MANQNIASSMDHNPEQIVIAENDREVLRNLAAGVAELAARPVEAEKRNLWYRLNVLEETRPVIFCDPENGWNEIITAEQMRCAGELARQWEMQLRKEIFWGEKMGDDRVVETFFDVPYVWSEGDWGMRDTKIGGEDGGAYTWDAPLKSYEDLNLLQVPRVLVDYEATEKLVSLAKEVLGDFLTVRLKGRWWWSLGMSLDVIRFRGLEQFMLDMYDHPDGLHRLMSIMRDGILARLDFLEKQRLLSLNNDSTYVGSGGFGYTRQLPQDDFDGKVRTRDMWGFCESQETVSISPEMFAEFIFPYQLPILERFGLNCYGCCEPLDKRWNVVKTAPGLRRVSVSPWSDPEDMADKLGDKYIFSMKPTPTDLAIPAIDEGYVRKNLRKALDITRGCRVEVIMKDNHTIGNNPQNVIRWCRIAREEAESTKTS